MIENSGSDIKWVTQQHRPKSLAFKTERICIMDSYM